MDVVPPVPGQCLVRTDERCCRRPGSAACRVTSRTSSISSRNSCSYFSVANPRSRDSFCLGVRTNAPPLSVTIVTGSDTSPSALRSARSRSGRPGRRPPRRGRARPMRWRRADSPSGTPASAARTSGSRRVATSRRWWSRTSLSFRVSLIFGLFPLVRAGCDLFWVYDRPWWLIRVHEARASSRRARWLVRVRSSGWPFHQACSRIRLTATAAWACSRRVLPSPR